MKKSLALGCLLALAACSVIPPYEPPRTGSPAAWVAVRPHGGEVAKLQAWWSRFDDPLIEKLIDAGQRESPTIAVAAARIDTARANARVAGAAFAPSVTANAVAQRSAAGVPPFAAPRSIANLTADAAWEIDLFGALGYAREAAVTRVQAREAEWHDARTTLAAEIASTYVALRACEALAEVQDQDVGSRSQTVELTDRKVQAGFTAPADATLLRASLTDARVRLVGQRAECDVLMKSLVFLTGADERVLRKQLEERRAQMPRGAAIAVDEVPAAVLGQRPDLAAAERELAAAWAETGVAEANRYPRFSLTGSIGLAYFRTLGIAADGTSWSFGPAFSLPLFDAGRRTAQADAARARFAELRAAYMQRARTAVREVEEALVRLDAANRRQADAESAARDFETFLNAAETRWQVGVGNLIELEEARRQTLSAKSIVIGLNRERLAQWVGLYKALGGGWGER